VRSINSRMQRETGTDPEPDPGVVRDLAADVAALLDEQRRHRAHELLAPGVSEEPTSPRLDDQIPAIESKRAGDVSGIPPAPLDLARITVVDERELRYRAP